mgnify:CR=1 FL=1
MIKTKNISEMLTSLIEEYRFNKSILDNVTRESVESTLVKNGNRLVRNSIDVSV